MTVATVEVNGSRLAYERAGAQTGLPVVLVHAGVCDQRMWMTSSRSSPKGTTPSVTTLVDLDDPTAPRVSTTSAPISPVYFSRLVSIEPRWWVCRGGR